MAAVTISIEGFLNKVNIFILNPLILLVFAIALLVFLYGVLQFIRNADSETGRVEGKKNIGWGLFGMFIMMSAYGLIRIILNTFGLTSKSTDYIQF